MALIEIPVALTQIFKPDGTWLQTFETSFPAAGRVVRDIQYEDTMVGGCNTADILLYSEFENTENIVAGNWVFISARGSYLSSAIGPGVNNLFVEDSSDFLQPNYEWSLGAVTPGQSNGQYIVIDDGVHQEIARITGHNGNQLFVGAFAGGNLVNGYAKGATVAILRWSGIITSRPRDIKRTAEMHIKCTGWWNRLNDVLDNYTFTGQEAFACILGVLNIQASAIPDIVLPSSLPSSGMLYTGTAQGEQIQQTILNIVQLANGNTANTTLSVATGSGATSFTPVLMTGVGIGSTLTFDSGNPTQETLVVATVVGGGGLINTSLASASVAGATTFTPASITNLQANSTFTLDTGSNQEVFTVLSATATTITTTTPAKFAHASGVSLYGGLQLGTSLTTTTAAKFAHATTCTIQTEFPTTWVPFIDAARRFQLVALPTKVPTQQIDLYQGNGPGGAQGVFNLVPDASFSMATDALNLASYPNLSSLTTWKAIQGISNWQFFAASQKTGNGRQLLFRGTGGSVGTQAYQSPAFTVTPNAVYTWSGRMDSSAVLSGTIEWSIWSSDGSTFVGTVIARAGASLQRYATKITIPGNVSSVVARAYVDNGAVIAANLFAVFDEPWLVLGAVNPLSESTWGPLSTPDVMLDMQIEDQDIRSLSNKLLIQGGQRSDGTSLQIVVEDSVSIGYYQQKETIVYQPSLTDDATAQDWGVAQLTTLAYPKSSGTGTLNLADLTTSARELILVTGFDDGSTYMFSPVTVDSDVNANGVVTQSLQVQQMLPDMSAIVSAILGQKTYRANPNQASSSNSVSGYFISAGCDFVINTSFLVTISAGVVVINGQKVVVRANAIYVVAPNSTTFFWAVNDGSIHATSSNQPSTVVDGFTGSQAVLLGLVTIINNQPNISQIPSLGAGALFLQPAPSGAFPGVSSISIALQPDGVGGVSATSTVNLVPGLGTPSWLSAYLVTSAQAGTNAWQPMLAAVLSSFGNSFSFTLNGLDPGQSYDLGMQLQAQDNSVTPPTPALLTASSPSIASFQLEDVITLLGVDGSMKGFTFGQNLIFNGDFSQYSTPTGVQSPFASAVRVNDFDNSGGGPRQTPNGWTRNFEAGSEGVLYRVGAYGNAPYSGGYSIIIENKQGDLNDYFSVVCDAYQVTPGKLYWFAANVSPGYPAGLPANATWYFRTIWYRANTTDFSRFSATLSGDVVTGTIDGATAPSSQTASPGIFDIVSNSPSSAGRTYSGTVTAPADAAFCRVVLYHYNNGNPTTQNWALVVSGARCYEAEQDHSIMSPGTQLAVLPSGAVVGVGSAFGINVANVNFEQNETTGSPFSFNAFSITLPGDSSMTFVISYSGLLLSPQTFFQGTNPPVSITASFLAFSQFISIGSVTNPVLPNLSWVGDYLPSSYNPWTAGGVSPNQSSHWQVQGQFTATGGQTIVIGLTTMLPLDGGPPTSVGAAYSIYPGQVVGVRIA